MYSIYINLIIEPNIIGTHSAAGKCQKRRSLYKCYSLNIKEQISLETASLSGVGHRGRSPVRRSVPVLVSAAIIDLPHGYEVGR
jgi:hypothetical protein